MTVDLHNLNLVPCFNRKAYHKLSLYGFLLFNIKMHFLPYIFIYYLSFKNKYSN